jgi:uncharacterized protein YcaQ
LQARCHTLAAQGFGVPRPVGRIDVRHFRRLFDTVGLLQLDSVNVLARAHYLPAFSRLGPYDRSALDRYTVGSGEVFEYWAHAASLLPIDTFPLYRHFMQQQPEWRAIRRLEVEHPGYAESVYRQVVEHGPLTVSDLANPGTRTGPWWGYGHGKLALEWLVISGRLATWRDPAFTRVHDLPERVYPATVLAAEVPARHDVYRDLLLRAARHHGIGTAVDLCDYYRIRVPEARPILAELVADGELEAVEVEGWRGPVYLHPESAPLRRPRGTALLSPFDPLVWHRDRTERLFGFVYRIEIYTPKEKRVYGYYTLPFLLDGALVGRVDLKADRRGSRLLVQAAHAEDGVDLRHVAGRLGTELETMARWLGLGEITVARNGNLAGSLRSAL